MLHAAKNGKGAGGSVGADVELDIEEAEACPICLVELRAGVAMLALRRCGHEYHACCLSSWLMMRPPDALRCPLCRRDVTEAAEPGGR
ncbi:hypothetical protein HK405_008513, partial [Cladochytrium tenue]